jgi:hypothetical protein
LNLKQSNPASPFFRVIHSQAVAVLAVCLGLVACGGSDSSVGAAASPSGSDREAPSVQIAAAAVDEPPAQVHIRVTSRQGEEDNIDVTGYCLTSNGTKPQASNGCFADAREWTVRIGPAWHVWARDAAGNVSAGVAPAAAPPKPPPRPAACPPCA